MRSFSVSSRVAVLATVLATASSAAHAAGLATIRLTAAKLTILADGKSTTTITADVRDDRGNVVPDGTVVRFDTNYGRLDTTTAATRNGVARVTLISADLPGVALVKANIENGDATPGTAEVTFSTDAEETAEGSWARIDGKEYVGYAQDFGIIQAIGKNGGAKVTYRNIEITADTLQLQAHGSLFPSPDTVSAPNNLVRAVGTVQLKRGDEKREYANLRYNLETGEGEAERTANGKFALVRIKGARLEETLDNQIARESFALEDISGSAVTVVTRSISLEPNSKLQLRRATFYLDGSKTLSLPYHIMSLSQKSLFSEQIVGYGANGVTVDFPLYYDVRPTAVGTAHIRHGARVGSSAYSGRPGWSLDLEHAYNGRGGMDGNVEVTGVTRQDWGARWNHAQRLDSATNSYLYVDFPNHRDLFGNANLSRRFRGFTLNANASASRTLFDNGAGDSTTAGDLRGQVYAETNPYSVNGNRYLRYSLSLSTGRQGYFGPNAPEAFNTRTAGIRFYTTPVPLGKRTSLSQSLSVGQTWISGGDGSARDGASILGTLSLAHTLTPRNTLRLNYDYTRTPRISAASSTGQHRLGANLSLFGSDRWNLSVSGTKSLDAPYGSVYGSMNVSLGGPWRGRITLASSRFSTTSYQDIEYALVRRIAGRDFALYYSTTAKRLQLDLTGVRF